MSVHNIVVASPDDAQRSTLARIVASHPAFRVIACTSDLMNTYNEVEAQLPKAVLIADVLASLPEFEVMHALFSTLDIRWLVVKSNSRSQESTSPGSSADLFSIAADAPESIMLRQLLSVTRKVISSVPAAQKPTLQRPMDQTLTATSATRPRIIGSRSGVGAGMAPAMPASARADHSPVHRPLTGPLARQEPILLIGASTGGVDALLSVLSHFTADCPPTLIVQHTGRGFGESLARLLDRQCSARVDLVTSSTPLRQGLVLIGAGTGKHLVLQDCHRRICGLDGESPVSGHVPSVDQLFRSAVPLATRVTAALLTGMGRDGAEGLKALRDAGAHTIAQDEASSVVYGMPRAAAELGAAARILPLDRIGPTLMQAATTTPSLGREALR